MPLSAPIEGFHEAVTGPGRGASRVSFELFPIEQAQAWLVAHDADRHGETSEDVDHVAELSALGAGQLEPGIDSTTPAQDGLLHRYRIPDAGNLACDVVAYLNRAWLTRTAGRAEHRPRTRGCRLDLNCVEVDS
jgi:hypothetical protein